MNHECSVVRDLLPLYAEELVNSETAEFVNAHLQECAACREAYAQVKEPARRPTETAPLRRLREKLNAMKVRTVILTAMLTAALFVSAFSVLSAPIYVPYAPETVTVESVSDGKLRLTFAETVTDFDYQFLREPEDPRVLYCEIEAWTTLWDKWFGGKKANLSATLLLPEGTRVLYLPNDGTEAVCIFGEMNGGVIALPRLVLGYYLAFALIALLALAALWVLLRKKERVRLALERIGLYPLSYALCHCVVVGAAAESYSAQRDFRLTVFLSILVYCCLLSLHSLLRLRRELRALDGHQ